MSIKKKILIISSSIAAFILIFCLAGYAIINSYLSKVNYDPGTETINMDIAPDQDTDSSSPQQEIDNANKAIEDNLNNNSTPLLYDKDVYNILLIGSDTRVSGGTGRSDSMILISINKKTQKIIATSLMRDIYLQIPGVQEGNRLNTAYAYGGADLLLKTVQQNFKISVDKYIAVDFFSFIDVIDKVGGVNINISDAEIKVANDYVHEINQLKGLPINDGIITQSGEQTLTGKQALGYARIRYVGNADFGRTDRQRTVLEQVFSKVKTKNISQLNDLLNTFLPEVTTNLGKGELFSLVLNMPTYKNYSLDSWRIPVDGAFSYMSIRKMSVLSIDFAKNIDEMKNRIYG